MIRKLHNETDREYHARWMREWRKANPHKRNDSQNKWRSTNPEKARASHKAYLKRRLEAEPDYYTNKQRRQNGLPEPTRSCPEACEACGQIEQRIHKDSGKRFSLALDHCHDTGQFRGWLCSICNTTAGRYDDDYERIKRLAKYLEQADERRN